MADASKQLYRSADDRMLGGVCGGLGAYFGIDPTVVRLTWVVVTILSGVLGGVVVYVLALVLMSEAPPALQGADSVPLDDSLDVRAWVDDQGSSQSTEPPADG